MKICDRVTTNIFGILILGILFTACGGAGRNMAESPQYREIVEEVNDLEFEIENEWALPTKYSRVSLLGNPNRIKFENDSVKISLPFFGERHAGGGYGDEGLIHYEGIPQDLEIEENPQKGTVKFSFEGSRGTENYDFLITVFHNGKTRTSVTSTQRDMIIYDGELQDGK